MTLMIPAIFRLSTKKARLFISTTSIASTIDLLQEHQELEDTDMQEVEIVHPTEKDFPGSLSMKYEPKRAQYAESFKKLELLRERMKLYRTHKKIIKCLSHLKCF